MTARPGAGNGDGQPEQTGAAQVSEVVHELVSPTAPGHPDDFLAAVDLEQVTPGAVPSRRRPSAAVAVAVVAGASLAGLAVAVAGEAAWVIEIDDRLHEVAVLHRGAVDVALAGAITWAGATTVALPVVAVVGALAPSGPRTWRDRVGSGALLAAIASTGVYAGLLLNGALDRARPPSTDWAGAAGGPAFPSGHTTMGTLLAATCAWALSARLTRGGSRVALWSAAVALAAAVGWSRWWLGVHWPSDVVGGWAFGAAWCASAAAGLAMWRRRRAAAALGPSGASTPRVRRGAR